jgi:hypothetical protein
MRNKNIYNEDWKIPAVLEHFNYCAAAQTRSLEGTLMESSLCNFSTLAHITHKLEHLTLLGFMPCRLVSYYWCFKEIWYFRLYGQAVLNHWRWCNIAWRTSNLATHGFALSSTLPALSRTTDHRVSARLYAPYWQYALYSVCTAVQLTKPTNCYNIWRPKPKTRGF